jgi:ABC-type uncharacterized transport system fused permease/ATPase subunit
VPEGKGCTFFALCSIILVDLLFLFLNPLCQHSYFTTVLQFFVLRDYARETLSLRWRSWMTSYYMKRYFKNRTFYRIQSQSLIDNPDQRVNDDLSAFTGTALGFSLTLFNAAVDLISFSNILYGIYPPLFIVLIVYSLGGTAISVFLGKVSYLATLSITFIIIHTLSLLKQLTVAMLESTEFGELELHAREERS